MTTNGTAEAPLTARFVEAGENVLLELSNTTDQQLKGVEILTVFLKDEESPGGASRTHIKFDEIRSIQPKEKVVLSHRTWIDGQPVGTDQDKLKLLKVETGGAKAYVLDISWENAEGKSRYQRIPVGH